MGSGPQVRVSSQAPQRAEVRRPARPGLWEGARLELGLRAGQLSRVMRAVQRHHHSRTAGPDLPVAGWMAPGALWPRSCQDLGDGGGWAVLLRGHLAQMFRCGHWHPWAGRRKGGLEEASHSCLMCADHLAPGFHML